VGKHCNVQDVVREKLTEIGYTESEYWA
jgi:hypothetical protein